MHEAYQGNAKWLLNRLVWAQILKLKNTTDLPLFQLQNLLQTGARYVLLGQPVVFAAPSTAPVRTVEEGTISGGLPVPAAGSLSLI